MYQRAQMKQEVKSLIAGVRPRPMWVALLYLVITSVGVSLIQSITTAAAGTGFLTNQLTEILMSGRDIEEALAEFVLMYADRLITLVGTMMGAALLSSVLATLWQGLMTVGFNGYCLDIARGGMPAVGRIFSGFPMFGKVILTSLLVWVFTTLWTLLYTVGLIIIVVIGALLMEGVPVVGVLLMVLGYAAFLVLEVRLALRYAMTNYVLLDTGKYGLEAITASKQMMRGNKGKLFVLALSFIGWYLIMYAIILVGCVIIGIIVGVGAAAGGVTMGSVAGMVGGIMFVLIVMLAAVYLLSVWLLPYVTTSVAKFYLFFKPQEPAAEESWPTLGSTYSENQSSDPVE